MPGMLAGLLAVALQNANPYAADGRLAIRSVTPSETPRLGSPTDVRLDLTASYRNPYDPGQIRVDARVETPGGKSYLQPAYLTRDFDRRLDGKTEVLTPKGPPYWNLRLTLNEPGLHRVTVAATDASGTVLAKTVSLTAKDDASSANSGPMGFVRVSERDRRFFETDRGQAFWPVGANVAWPSQAGTYDYDRWIPRYAENGLSLMRIWLSPEWNPLSLERKGAPDRSRGYGYFDPEAAWRVDRILRQLRDRGMRAQLCLESYNMLRDKDAANYWENSVWNRRNGGPLDFPTDFWNSPVAEKTTAALLRYVVARYGADPAVFAWELWNEVDLTRDFPVDRARAWHSRTASALRALDPYYRHPITSSVSNTSGVKEIDLLPELDFLQTHSYTSEDPVSPVVVQGARKGGWGKPHLPAEIGASGSGPESRDTRGVQIHDPIWAALAGGSAGSAMAWWWDSYTEPKNVYGVYSPLAKFVKGIDFPREGFRPTRPIFGYLDPGRPPVTDLDLPLLSPSWAVGPENRARTVRVEEGGASGSAPGMLHGLKNHPELHNPLTLVTDLPRRTRFDVIVGGVSGYGGGRLVVRLDGSVVMTRDFPDADPSNETMTKYAGEYGFDLPAGHHRIEVENTGDDWFEASYRFKGAQLRRQPAFDAWALVGERTVIVWARNSLGTLGRLARGSDEGTVPPTYCRLEGLASGSYDVQLWDTWKGEPMRTMQRDVPLSGVLTVPLPPIGHDVAIKAILRDGR